MDCEANAEFFRKTERLEGRVDRKMTELLEMGKKAEADALMAREHELDILIEAVAGKVGDNNLLVKQIVALEADIVKDLNK